MIKIKRIDHVAIAVPDRDAAAGQLGALFGLETSAREHVASQATEVALLSPAGDAGGATALEATALEICAPRDNAALDRFLAHPASTGGVLFELCTGSHA